MVNLLVNSILFPTLVPKKRNRTACHCGSILKRDYFFILTTIDGTPGSFHEPVLSNSVSLNRLKTLFTCSFTLSRDAINYIILADKNALKH